MSKHFTIDSALGLTHKSSTKDKPESKPDKSNDLLLAKSLNIGYYLITPILIGVFFGVAVDNVFKTQPRFALIFLIVGVTSTFYNLFKLVKDGDRSTH